MANERLAKLDAELSAVALDIKAQLVKLEEAKYRVLAVPEESRQSSFQMQSYKIVSHHLEHLQEKEKLLLSTREKLLPGPCSARPMLTPTAMIEQWSKCTSRPGTLASSLELQTVDGTSFGLWFTASRQRSFEAWINNTQGLTIPPCGREPDEGCCEIMGQLAKRLVVVAALLDTAAEGDAITSSDLEGHLYNTCLRVAINKPLECAKDASLGFRQPAYALLYQAQGTQLGQLHYKELLQAGELLQAKDEPMELPAFKDKLAQCLDHAERSMVDMSAGHSRQLSFEISDGVCTRCAVAVLHAPRHLHLGSSWLQHLRLPDLATPGPALKDKLMLAFHVHQQLKVLLQAAAEPQEDTCTTEPQQVAVGAWLEVTEDSGHGDDLTSCAHDSRQLHDQHTRRLLVRVTATLGQSKQRGGGMALVLAGTLEDGGKSGPRGIVLKLGSTPGTSAGCEQLAREHLALLSLRGAGGPYLPRFVAAGVVTNGAQQALCGASALMTELRGAPLHKYLAWHRAVTMAPHHVLLAAACLAAAVCSLLAHNVRSNDVRPENITVTYSDTLQGCMYHLVDLGASSCPALNSPGFRAAWGFTELADLSNSAPVCDLLFGSLEALLAGADPIEPPPLLPLSDLQSVLFCLVFLASGSLPWMGAARQRDLDAAIQSRRLALNMAAAWEGLSVLPEPVARFGGWVLGNATRDVVPVQEVKQQVDLLFSAVQRDLGVNLPSLELPASASGVTSC